MQKEVEILVLCHQLTILGRQHPRPRFQPPDRALLRRSAASCPGPMVDLPGHAQDAAWVGTAGWCADTGPSRHCARPTIGSRPGAVLDRTGHREPREPAVGYQRIRGELLRLGFWVSTSSIARVLRTNGLQPTPRRAATSTTWRSFLHRQAAARSTSLASPPTPPAPGLPSKPATWPRLMRRPPSSGL
jgi:putative transposase